MAVTLSAPLTARVGWPHAATRGQVVVILTIPERATPMPLLARAVTGYAAVFAVLQVALVAQAPDADRHQAVAAGIATAALLPLLLRLVAHAARGTRPPGAGASLLALTILTFGAVPLAGSYWQPTFHVLVVAAVIVLPMRWSIPVAAAIVVAQVPLAAMLHNPQPAAPSYEAFTVLWRAAAVFVPVWLVRTIGQLEVARRSLAEDAVLRERVATEDQLRVTVGESLSSIAAQAERAREQVGRRPHEAAAELHALVDEARITLAETRRLVRAYHRPSVLAELQTATILLRAAGVAARVEAPSGVSEDVADAGFRSDLRAATSRLMRDEDASPCTFVVSRHGERLRLEVRHDIPMTAVPR